MTTYLNDLRIFICILSSSIVYIKRSDFKLKSLVKYIFIEMINFKLNNRAPSNRVYIINVTEVDS